MYKEIIQESISKLNEFLENIELYKKFNVADSYKVRHKVMEKDVNEFVLVDTTVNELKYVLDSVAHILAYHYTHFHKIDIHKAVNEINLYKLSLLNNSEEVTIDLSAEEFNIYVELVQGRVLGMISNLKMISDKLDNIDRILNENIEEVEKSVAEQLIESYNNSEEELTEEQINGLIKSYMNIRSMDFTAVRNGIANLDFTRLSRAVQYLTEIII